MMEKRWSFEREGTEDWVQDFFDTKEVAIEAGRQWAKEKGLDRFCVGRGEYIPIPTEPDIGDIFNRLDEEYYDDCNHPDADYAPFDESVRKENETAKERLEEKVSKALKEYVEEASVTGGWYRIEDTQTILTFE